MVTEALKTLKDQDDDNLVNSAIMPQEIASEVDDDPAVDTSKTSKKQRGEMSRWKNSHVIPQPDLIQKVQSAKQILLMNYSDIAGSSEWAVFD